MNRLESSIEKQHGITGPSWKKGPWEKLSLQPASTSAAAYQGSLGQTAPSYAPGAQIMGQAEPKKQAEPEKQEKISDVGTAVPIGPSTSPTSATTSSLPTPTGRNEVEEQRAETRQRTQLAKGVSPETLTEKETVNRNRTYRPTSRDPEQRYDVFADLPSPPVSTHAASYQGQAKISTVPYAARLQEETPKGRATRATPKTDTWKMEKRQTRRPEKTAVYDRMYRTEEPGPGETAGQGAFRRYVKTPSPEERLHGYMVLMEQPDFEEKSAYQNTYHKDREQFSAVTGTYLDTGFDDILYDYINGNDIARGRVSLVPGVRTYKDVPGDAVRLFNYIYRTKSPEEAYDFMDLISQKQFTGLEAAAFGAMDKM